MNPFRIFLFVALLLWMLPNSLRGQSAEVWVFLSEDCPVSLSQSLELKALEDQFGSQYTFVYAFPISSDETAIQAFLNKAKLNGKVMITGAWEQAHAWGATTMPEAFVYDATGRKVYQGRIDNSFSQIGQRQRGKVVRDLYELLSDLMQNAPIAFRQTAPVGCLIPTTKTTTSP